MKVILLRDIAGTGKKGDIKDISDGYARNFLFPKGLAKLATSGAVDEVEAIAQKAKKKAAQELKQAQTMAAHVDGAEVEITGKVSAEGTLYAAVSQKMIADAIAKQLKTPVDQKQVRLPKPIKEAGEFHALVSFGHGLEVDVRIIVGAA